MIQHEHAVKSDFHSGSNSSRLANMRRNASWPVWPPAPVTATRLGAAAAASAAVEARSHRCIAACLCSRVVLPEQLASAHFRTLTASWLPVHRCGDVMRSLGRAYTRLGAPVRRVKGKTTRRSLSLLVSYRR